MFLYSVVFIKKATTRKPVIHQLLVNILLEVLNLSEVWVGVGSMTACHFCNIVLVTSLFMSFLKTGY